LGIILADNEFEEYFSFIPDSVPPSIIDLKTRNCAGWVSRGGISQQLRTEVMGKKFQGRASESAPSFGKRMKMATSDVRKPQLFQKSHPGRINRQSLHH
jgi:hypothetical protein